MTTCWPGFLSAVSEILSPVKAFTKVSTPWWSRRPKWRECSSIIFETAIAVLLLGGAVVPSRGVELTVSRQALERTLKQQLFSGPDGRYYLKGNSQSGCFISTEDPHLSFEQDRMVVR